MTINGIILSSPRQYLHDTYFLGILFCFWWDFGKAVSGYAWIPVASKWRAEADAVVLTNLFDLVGTLIVR